MMLDETRLAWTCREANGEDLCSRPVVIRQPLLPRCAFTASDAAEAYASQLDVAAHEDIDTAVVASLDCQVRHIEVEIASGVWCRYRTVCRVRIEYNATKE